MSGQLLLRAGSLLLVLLGAATATAADSCRLAYKMVPGQIWLTEVVSQFKSDDTRTEDMEPTRYTVRYRVLKGDREGWVKLEAKIVSHSAQSEGGMDYSKLTYTADMHTSGELRHVAHTGSATPPIPAEQLAQMPPEYRAMMQQSSDMVAKAMQQGVFWFPELPEEKLSLGDAFDSVQKSELGSGGMMQSQTVVKTEYTLEDVSEGLAYFSVRQRAQSKSSGMGGSSDTRVAGKADAIFDLKLGMWVEMTMKSRVDSSFGGMAGMAGESGGMNISRFRMQLQ